MEEVKQEQKQEQETIGEGVNFERIRRITGYLVGSLERFNDGKKAEEHDRVKHSKEGLDVYNIHKERNSTEDTNKNS